MKTALLTLLCGGLSLTAAHAQLADETWNKNYPPAEYKSIIDAESRYLAHVIQKRMTPDYYRFDKYRLQGRYTGRRRAVSAASMAVMRDVCAVYSANLPKPDFISNLVKNEYQFVLNGVEVWLPIQEPLEASLQEEVPVGATAYLYCVLFNSHHENEPVSNVFLISEFSR